MGLYGISFSSISNKQSKKKFQKNNFFILENICNTELLIIIQKKLQIYVFNTYILLISLLVLLEYICNSNKRKQQD